MLQSIPITIDLSSLNPMYKVVTFAGKRYGIVLRGISKWNISRNIINCSIYFILFYFFFFCTEHTLTHTSTHTHTRTHARAHTYRSYEISYGQDQFRLYISARSLVYQALQDNILPLALLKLSATTLDCSYTQEDCFVGD